MADALPSTAPLPQTDRFPITITGRIFPTRLRPELQPEPPAQDTERNERLAERLWSTLPFSDVNAPADEALDTVRVYEASLRRLNEHSSDLDALFRAICEANLEIRHADALRQAASRERMREKQLQEMVSRIEFAGLPTGTALTAGLVSQSPATVHKTLQQALKRICRKFVDNLFDALDRMVDRELIGVIQWHERAACQFHFFRQSVTYEETSRELLKTSQSTAGKSSAPVLFGNWVPTTRGTRTFGHARHEHHLMSARRSNINDADVVIPQPVQKMLQRIPDWLVEFVGIVDGQRIRERIIERDLKEEATKLCDEVIRIREREVLHIDPAVTFDFYVLTGWGECDINTEIARREEVARGAEYRQREQTLGQRAKTQLAIGIPLTVLLFVLSVVLTIAGVHASRIWIVLAGATIFAGLIPVRFLLDAVRIRRGRKPHWTFEMAGLTAAAAAWGGILFLVGGAQVWSWTALGCGALLFLLAYPLILLTHSFWRDLPSRTAPDGTSPSDESAH